MEDLDLTQASSIDNDNISFIYLESYVLVTLFTTGAKRRANNQKPCKIYLITQDI